MVRKIVGVTLALLAGGTGAAIAQHPPGMQGSRNIKVMSHIPLSGRMQVADIEIEQELSRPYAYIPIRVKDAGFFTIDLKNPEKARILHRWTIENPELHQGHALGPAYVKTKGRYYLFETFQFRSEGADGDLGAILFDMTGLPDTTKIREVARIRLPESPGGFHENYAYKHSNGSSLVLTTVSGKPHAAVWDVDKIVAGDPKQGLIGTVPNPGGQGGYHDFYVGYDPVSKQDRFYGAGRGGFYVIDITNIAEPKVLTSGTGIAGMSSGHTFTPDPTGRYAILESEYTYAPLRIIDLKPGLDGTVQTVSRPIGAWTAKWNHLAHNHEVRWPYVFVSAYRDGMYVFNMMDPTNPYTVGYYDTFDGNDNPVDGLDGPFGVDVRNADGLIVLSDLSTGFWAFKMEGFDGWNGKQWGVPNISSVQDWDNGPEGAPQKVS